MAFIEPLLDLSDLEPLSIESGLFLKPYVKLSISIKIPVFPGHNFALNPKHLPDHIIRACQPFRINSLALIKNTLEIIRFSCEVECISDVSKILSRLNGLTIQLEGLGKPLKVKANVVKTDFPSKEEWESFFKSHGSMRSSQPGERPDTLYLSNLPSKWFTKVGNKPSEIMLVRIFQQFGPIRAIDIPSNDAYRHRMKGHESNTFFHDQHSYFDAYVQFKEYVGFANAMETLRDKKLVKKTDDGAYLCKFKVTFDKSKHLSFWAISYREVERNSLVEADKEASKKKLVKEELVEIEREVDGPSEESTDKQKEEGSFSMYQQRLESFRLLKFLLNRLKERHIWAIERNNNERINQESKNSTTSLPPGVSEEMIQREKELRERLLLRMRLKNNEARNSQPRHLPKESLKSVRKVRPLKRRHKRLKRKHSSQAHSSSSTDT